MVVLTRPNNLKVGFHKSTQQRYNNRLATCVMTLDIRNECMDVLP